MLPDNVKLWKREEVVRQSRHCSRIATSERWANAKKAVDAVCRSEPSRGLRKQKEDLKKRLKETRELLKSEAEEQHQFDASEPQHKLQRQLQYGTGELRLHGLSSFDGTCIYVVHEDKAPFPMS